MLRAIKISTWKPPDYKVFIFLARIFKSRMREGKKISTEKQFKKMCGLMTKRTIKESDGLRNTKKFIFVNYFHLNSSKLYLQKKKKKMLTIECVHKFLIFKNIWKSDFWKTIYWTFTIDGIKFRNYIFFFGLVELYKNKNL